MKKGYALNEYHVYQHGPKKGQCKTMHDRVVRYLLAHDCNEKSSRSKYRFFVHASGKFYFVGNHGAVRTGINASNSFSITDVIHAKLELWENKK